MSLFTHRWLGNRYVVATITEGMCFGADLLTHPSDFGSTSTQAIMTGAFTGAISLTLNFIGKKLFTHSRNKLTRD